ncbi:MAG: ferrous iron transport protein A [Candidatus Omnitrophica bacterium]|nr:ferrous iron transport protein A [Candidatus Omnitrophota bacterium]MBU4589430.1 ferrous iron transport protein A [Candidatus Omnitrophota bacterium]
MVIDLTRVKNGESGIIKEFDSGYEFMRKIQSMGIRPGKNIKKLSSHFWRGPQTVEVDNVRVAIGWGMAKNIFIEVNR